MIGSTRSRRLGVLLGGVALVIIVAGCTVGSTTIPAGSNAGLVECKGGPTPGKYWVPGSGAQVLRFEVLSSDATKPMMGVTEIEGEGYFGGFVNAGRVWDGTKSTGPIQWTAPALPKIPMYLFYEDLSAVEPAQPSNTKWAFTALDANGKDVGFTCSD
jgi:hypothetical protein